MPTVLEVVYWIFAIVCIIFAFLKLGQWAKWSKKRNAIAIPFLCLLGVLLFAALPKLLTDNFPTLFPHSICPFNFEP